MKGRNHGMHTPARLARARVLMSLFNLGQGAGSSPSALASVAFVGYVFRTPQGAAFAVSKVLRGLVSDGLIRWGVGSTGVGRGYRLTPDGRAKVRRFWGGD